MIRSSKAIQSPVIRAFSVELLMELLTELLNLVVPLSG